MEKYRSPKSKVSYQEEKPARPLWFSIVILVVFVPIIFLLPYSATISFSSNANKIFDLFLFPMVLITAAGLIGLWFMRLWGVALLVVSYLLFVVMLSMSGYTVGIVESLFGLVYILLYIYIKRCNITKVST